MSLRAGWHHKLMASKYNHSYILCLHNDGRQLVNSDCFCLVVMESIMLIKFKSISGKHWRVSYEGMVSCSRKQLGS